MTIKVLLMIALYFQAMGVSSYRVNLANQDYIDCSYTGSGDPVCALTSWETCLNYSLPCSWFNSKQNTFRVHLVGSDFLSCSVEPIKCKVVHKSPCDTIDGQAFTTSLCKRPTKALKR